VCGDPQTAHAAVLTRSPITELKKQHTLLYKAYAPLHDSGSNDSPGEAALKTIESLIETGQWASAKRGASVLIRTGLQGLHYLQTYDRFLIRAIVTFAYIGWACFTSMYIFRPIKSGGRPYRVVVSFVAGGVLAVFWGAFVLQKSPWTFYLYVSFPVYFWQQFLTRGAPDLLARVRKQGSPSLLVWFVFVVASTQAMVVRYFKQNILPVTVLANDLTGWVHTPVHLERWIWPDGSGLASHLAFAPEEPPEPVWLLEPPLRSERNIPPVVR
jgi:phosphatidylinositol glycan class N